MLLCDWCGKELKAGWCVRSGFRYHADCFMLAIRPIKKIKSEKKIVMKSFFEQLKEYVLDLNYVIFYDDEMVCAVEPTDKEEEVILSVGPKAENIRVKKDDKFFAFFKRVELNFAQEKKTEKKELKAFSNGVEILIAEDQQEAIKLVAKEQGYANIEDYFADYPNETWEELAMDKELTVEIEYGSGYLKEIHLVKKWIEMFGKGCLGSSEK